MGVPGSGGPLGRSLMIQGISYWNLFYELTLTDRNMQARICLKVVLISRGVDIWVSSTSFQKNNIGWPQQPPTEKIQISVKIWVFDYPFHKKRLLLVIWLPGGIQSSGAVIFLMEWGCKGHWGHGGCWGCRGHWGCRGFKAWKITDEDFRVIQVLVISFILLFWKRKKNDRIMKCHVEF